MVVLTLDFLQCIGCVIHIEKIKFFTIFIIFSCNYTRREHR